MKLLLYCTKGKEILWCNHKYTNGHQFFMDGRYNRLLDDLPDYLLNGKIVAECDFEVEKIFYSQMFCNYTTWSLGKDDLLNKSCLTHNEIKNYLGTKDVIGNDGYNGYAIHIKNLHIFDEPKELRNYFTRKPYNDINKIFTDEVMRDGDWYRPIKNAPQNMMYAQEVVPFKEEHLIKGVLQEFRGNRVNEYILISIQPQWLCKILNGEKTIEVRKKVLRGMLDD